MISFSRSLAAVAITITGLTVPLAVVDVPAHADFTSTVKAKTQRMTDANLGSRQDGWYEVGDQVTLVCSKRGQKVKGFFSFNVPGGWDDLWYKTTDDHYIADVDIETQTLKDVTGPCGPDAPATAPVTSAAPTSGSDACGGNPNMTTAFVNDGYSSHDDGVWVTCVPYTNVGHNCFAPVGGANGPKLYPAGQGPQPECRSIYNSSR